VARVLTAAEMGFKPEQVVTHIETGLARMAPEVSADRRTALVSQATTYGLTFSREIEELSGEIPKHITASELAQMVAQMVAKARKAGADIDTWLRARSLCMVFASFAEAKFLGEPVLDVVRGARDRCYCRPALLMKRPRL
jgi:hypothetical protein